MKFMNMKRFGAAVMTGALALSLAVPAFASSTTITGAYQAATVDVTVSSATGTAQINPYGLPIDLKAADNTVLATVIGEQITTTTPLYISNKSKVAFAVTATVTGAEDSDGAAKLVSDLTTGVTDTVTPKNIVAKFEAFPAPGVEGVIDPDDLAEPFAALDSANAVLTAPVLVGSNDTTGTLVLREGAEINDPDNAGQKIMAPQDGSVAYFRLSGSVVKTPTTAWAAADKFTAAIAFTFEPSEYVGTVELSEVETVAAGATADITVTLPDGVTAKKDTIKWTSSKTANVTVADSSTADTDTPANAAAVKGTVTGVKSASTKATITVEFESTDGVIYRGSTQVKCG